jgi:hypothetical protein
MYATTDIAVTKHTNASIASANHTTAIAIVSPD